MSRILYYSGAMNGVWPVIISAALCFVLAFVVHHHYGKIGFFVVLVWILPGLIDFWLHSLSLESATRIYEKFGGLIQLVGLIAFILWFRSRYDLKISIELKAKDGIRINQS
jgi:hypothetical protein